MLLKTLWSKNSAVHKHYSRGGGLHHLLSAENLPEGEQSCWNDLLQAEADLSQADQEAEQKWMDFQMIGNVSEYG